MAFRFVAVGHLAAISGQPPDLLPVLLLVLEEHLLVL